jgi:hypothetical protein
MSQQDHELAGKIVQHLDYGTEQIDQETAGHLLAARKSAMLHYRDKPAPAWGVAWVGHAGVRLGRHRSNARYLFAVAALVIGLVGAIYWKSRAAPANDIAEIDLNLLTDDLPINAYLDRGFDSWLKRSSR